MYRIIIFCELEDDLADSPDELVRMIKNKEVILERSDIADISAIKVERSNEDVKI